MNFLKGFLGGVVFALLVMLLLPMFIGEEMHADFSNLSNGQMLVLGEIILVCGMGFGLLYQFLAWIGKKKQEKEEMNDLMREYLEKKLREDAEKDK